MTLEAMIKRRDEIKCRLDLLNVRSTGRDRLERELDYLNAMIAQKGSQVV